MSYLLNKQYTIQSGWGRTRTGKTVTVAVFDSDGNAKATGYTLSSVIELSDGYYGATITFTEAFDGYFKWINTTDGLTVWDNFVSEPDVSADITILKQIEVNRWKIVSNQLVIYDDDATTPLYTFDLKRNGLANGVQPDERVPV